MIHSAALDSSRAAPHLRLMDWAELISLTTSALGNVGTFLIAMVTLLAAFKKSNLDKIEAINALMWRQK